MSAQTQNGSTVLHLDHYQKTITAKPVYGHLVGSVDGRFEVESSIYSSPLKQDPI